MFPNVSDQYGQLPGISLEHHVFILPVAGRRYHARQGKYAGSGNDLDIDLPDLEYFSAQTVKAGDTNDLETSWSITLTRQGAAAGYGAYTVRFTEKGFDSDSTESTIAKFPSINPMKTN